MVGFAVRTGCEPAVPPGSFEAPEPTEFCVDRAVTGFVVLAVVFVVAFVAAKLDDDANAIVSAQNNTLTRVGDTPRRVMVGEVLIRQQQS